MKIQVTFKTPDVVDYAIRCAVENMEVNDPYEREDKSIEISDILSKWVNFDEYITVEFDTEEKTAIVIKR